MTHSAYIQKSDWLGIALVVAASALLCSALWVVVATMLQRLGPRRIRRDSWVSSPRVEQLAVTAACFGGAAAPGIADHDSFGGCGGDRDGGSGD